jgi:hypothetical protein
MANGYTSFPDSVQRFDIKTDVSSSVYSDWKQFNTYVANGQFANATTLLQSNTELQKCIIDGNYINTLSKTVEEVEDLFLNKVQTYIHETVIHKGEWSNKIKYTKYNFVTFKVYGVTQTFECLRDDTPIGVEPTNTIYWVQRTIKGEQGESGTGLTPRGVWSEYTTYYKDDLVVLNNILWVANEENRGHAPHKTSSVWYSILSLNFVLAELKIQDEEIDAIINGSAELKDGEPLAIKEDAESISRDDIDKVLSN